MPRTYEEQRAALGTMVGEYNNPSWVPIEQGAIPGQTYDRTTGALTNPKTDRDSHAPRDAPEPDSH